MATLRGKMSGERRGHAPKEIVTPLPEGITHKDGKYYQDGKELKPEKKTSLREFLNSTTEEVPLKRKVGGHT